MDIISMYAPDKQCVVYDQKARRADDRDPINYGRDIDLGTSFLEQFQSLLQEVPIISLKNTFNQNSEYVNLCGYIKDCYLIFASEYAEHCYYGQRILDAKDCVDNVELIKGANCYENIHTENCYDLLYAQNCKTCAQSYFLYDCEWCNNCLLCVGLRNAQYCIHNKQHTKEEYEQEKTKLLSGDLAEYKQQFLSLCMELPHKNLEQVQTERVLWDYAFSSKNIRYGFDCIQAEDCAYTYAASKVKQLMDVTNTTEQELAYDSVSVWYNSTNCLFTCGWRTSSNLIYCFDCHNSSYLFGCSGLRNKSYCILNKQYSREEYETLVPQIIERMKSDLERGEFFPSHLSLFGYNETIANEYFPLIKEEAIKKWFKRCDYEAPFPSVEKMLKANEIPQNIDDVSDDILDQAIICEISGKPFRITKPELQFYRKHKISLPKRHPDQRHLDRMAQRNPRRLRDRQCAKCWINIKTSYSPERKEIIYCEQCYNKEIY